MITLDFWSVEWIKNMKLLTIKNDLHFPWHWSGLVCVDSLADEPHAQVFPLQRFVDHAIGDGAIGGDLVGRIKQTTVLVPSHFGRRYS